MWTEYTEKKTQIKISVSLTLLKGALHSETWLGARIQSVKTRAKKKWECFDILETETSETDFVRWNFIRIVTLARIDQIAVFFDTEQEKKHIFSASAVKERLMSTELQILALYTVYLVSALLLESYQATIRR